MTDTTNYTITEEKIKEMQQKGLAVCIPAYGGLVHLPCMQSLLGLQQLFMSLGIPLEFHFQINESLVQRSRNYLADSFLRSNERFDKMIFIDADIQFDPKDILIMYSMDKDVIGGSYPLKTLKWDNIEKGIKRFGVNAFKASDYNKVTGTFVFNLEEGTTQLKINEPQKVKYLGTGLQMISRNAFKKFEEAYPQYKYLPDHKGTEFFDGSREITSFFNVEIEPESRRLLSEDYMWNHHLRKIGIDIWCCPWTKTTHYGNFGFQGSMADIANIVGELS